jgi:mevalonate kinase
MDTLHFRSNGKLMISGEYLVLAGAGALAVPVRMGQSMKIDKTGTAAGFLEWTARENGREWFRARFEGIGLAIREASDKATAETLQTVLLEARKMNPRFLDGRGSWLVTTDLEFDRQWGLGSSSTLVSNLAWWADVNPYQLLFRTLGGSGYDIACARSQSPLIFNYRGHQEQPRVRVVGFHPVFSENLYFVYTGKKQSSSGSLEGFRAAGADPVDVRRISEISAQMLITHELEKFKELMLRHEKITAKAIGKTPVMETTFSDFEGAVKSLGAWGGDFLLVASSLDRADLTDYFMSRGCDAPIPFDDLVLKLL